MNSVTSNAVKKFPIDSIISGEKRPATSDAVFSVTNVKICNVAEGESVTTSKWGIFTFGAGIEFYVTVVGANTTVSATTAFWGGDPSYGNTKRMLGLYI